MTKLIQLLLCISLFNLKAGEPLPKERRLEIPFEGPGVEQNNAHFPIMMEVSDEEDLADEDQEEHVERFKELISYGTLADIIEHYGYDLKACPLPLRAKAELDADNCPLQILVERVRDEDPYLRGRYREGFKIAKYFYENGARIEPYYKCEEEEKEEHATLNTYNFALESQAYSFAFYLQKKYVNVNLIDREDEGGFTPLTSICRLYPRRPALKSFIIDLLRKIDNIDQCDGLGHTPLTTACAIGNLRMVEWLIKKGANVNQSNNNNITPIKAAQDGLLGNNYFTVDRDYAVQNPQVYIDIIELLKSQGAHTLPETNVAQVNLEKFENGEEQFHCFSCYNWFSSFDLFDHEC